MSDPLVIKFEPERRDFGSPDERATYGAISIFLGAQSITELEDSLAKAVFPHLYASASVLAEWMVANFWRLRWEPERESVDWALSHRVGAAGGGYVWPDLAFASDGEEIHITGHQTTGSPIEPLRYLKDFQGATAARDFERAIDVFVDTTLSRMRAFGLRGSCLEDAWKILSAERCDGGISLSRKMEALLGFDAEEAPDGILDALHREAKRIGQSAVEEIAASEGLSAPSTIGILRECDTALGMPISLNGTDALRQQLQASTQAPPWRRAIVDACTARRFWNIEDGPITNAVLGDVLRLPACRIEEEAEIPAAFRLASATRTEDSDSLRVALVKRWTTGRRFSLARLVGDHLVAHPAEVLLPSTDVKTSRQKYQRAFAQEFLCPFSQLQSFLGTGRPTDDDMESAAKHFEVSPLLVRTTLVNNGVLERTSIAAA